MNVLFGDKPSMNPLAIVDSSRRNEIRESTTLIGAVAESGSVNESGEGTEEESEREGLEEEGALEETTLSSNTVPQPTVLRCCHRRQHSVVLEEGLGNRRTSPKKRRTDGNAAADLANVGDKRKMASNKEKLRLIEENVDLSRRLEHENAKELMILGGKIKKGLMEKEAQLKLLYSLFANKATEEEIDWHMRIFQKYNS